MIPAEGSGPLAHYPAEGRLEALYLTPSKLTNGLPAGHPFVVVTTISGNPGSKIEWPPSASVLTSAFNTVRLLVTNDTELPLLELRIPIKVSYGLAPNQTVYNSHLATIRLDPGAGNQRVIYIVNQVSEGGVLEFGEVAMASEIGDPRMRPVRITKPQNVVFQFGLLSPFEPAHEEAPPKKPSQTVPDVSEDRARSAN